MSIRQYPQIAPTATSITDSTGGSSDGTLLAASIASDKFWAFDSLAGAFGTYYIGGFYIHSGTASDFSGGPTFGTANKSYAAHFFVVLGADTVDELTIRVTGTSITDAAVRTTTDTEDIVIPNATSANAYFETDKKWLGQVTITVVSGTAKTCDYGFSKYWDNLNNDFTVTGLEVTWLGGANDSGANIELLHHKTTGWTYTGSGATPPTPLAAMDTDHSTESEVGSGVQGAWKRTGLATDIDASGSEGTLWRITTTANNAFNLGTMQLQISVTGNVNNNFADIASKINALVADIDNLKRHSGFFT